jgi:hypothetical protein
MARNEWFSRNFPQEIDLGGPGIYAWHVDGRLVYVGKATKLRSRIREYRNNIERIRSGRPYRRGNVDGFRRIHRELARAVEAGVSVSISVLETCEPGAALLACERFWLETYSPPLNGPDPGDE